MPPNTLSSTSTIVPELLTSDSYTNWSALMRNYLLAQDLWDIVEATTEPPTPEDDVVEFKAWRKNNAAALYAILISCGVDILSEIREMNCAKSVWDKLASMYGPSNSSNIPADSSNTPEISFAGTSSINNDDYWVAVSCFRRSQEYARSAGIENYGGTSLHFAVFAGDTEIVKMFVEYMLKEELEKKDDYGLTALARAAIQQNTEMVQLMLTKNPDLLHIPDNSNRTPLITALDYGHIDMALLLYFVSLQNDQTLRDIDASTALTRFILLNNFDIALHLLHRYPRSPIVPNIYDTSPLAALASKSSAFPSGNQLVFWKKWIYDCIPIPSRDSISCIPRRMPSFKVQSHEVKIRGSGSKQNLKDTKLQHHQAGQLLQKMCTNVKQMNSHYVKEAILQAVKGGNVEFILEIVKKDPRLLYTIDTMGRNIFFYAVLHRQTKIFRLIYTLDEKNLITNALDSSGNTILHMAAMLEHSIERDRLTGAALKMQSELQWFKEVERTCLPWIHEIRNDTKMTAKELFTHNHKDMLNEGEKWMKGTASSCTLIGTIIVTIMFTAAFTVPGGNNQNTGFPMFSHKKLFTVFIISDSLSLFSASTSVLVFLGMVTSRYAEDDFSRSLPLKMIIGHYTLFFSIVTMMIAFCAGLFIMLPRKLWMVILTICLASVTVIQFAYMLFPLLVYMLKQIVTYRLGRYLQRLF